ncbi:MAG: D-alanine--D-alanine ligase [Candidatus Omnitrophica bacterium]|nr:D-alanine--D-alanine ligase [Candidatus Omnitrophota bacterium]
MSNPLIQRVAVLCGGLSCEREISFLSGKAVADALSGLGMDIVVMDPIEKNFIERLKKENIGVAFLALHGTFGEDGTIQRLLEEAGIVYTGDGPGPSEAAFDKSISQARFAASGVRVPRFQILKGISEKPEGFSYPFVIKPAKGGSSVGVHLVRDAEDSQKSLRDAFRFSESVIAEEYIRGRELTVGILGKDILPVGEIIARRTFYDYEAKYGDAGTRYEFPARLTEEEARDVRDAAWMAYKAVGCEVMGRVDIILDAAGQPYVLEINTIPGLTGKSLLPKAAKARGFDFPQLCVRIMELSKGK